MKKKLLCLALMHLFVVACSEPTSASDSTSVSLVTTTSSEDSTQSDSEDTTISEDITSSDETTSEEIASDEETTSQEESTSSEEPVPEGYYRIQYHSLLLKDEEGEFIPIHYDIPDEFLSFDHESNTFKKELALAAFAFVASAPEADTVTEAYQHFDFDDLYLSEDYGLEEEADTVKYAIGHKKVEDTNIINLTISGYQYKKPWQNNFNLGLTGNHAGFANGANKVLPNLVNYLKKYQGEDRTILFINGFSRASAISNILITSLIDNELIEDKDLYAYLFETPIGVESKDEREYPSVFNVINNADIVTHIAPASYGFRRIGTDIDMYKENAADIIKEFDERLDVGVFTPNEGYYTNDIELTNYLIDYLLTPVDEESLEVPSKDMSTRENYYKNVQDDITYLMGFFFSLPEEVLPKVMDKFQNTEMMELLSLLQEDGIYNFLKPILDECEVSYEEEVLKAKLNNALYLVQQKPTLLSFAMSEEQRNNLLREVYFHTLEGVLPLLIAL